MAQALVGQTGAGLPAGDPSPMPDLRPLIAERRYPSPVTRQERCGGLRAPGAALPQRAGPGAFQLRARLQMRLCGLVVVVRALEAELVRDLPGIVYFCGGAGVAAA